MRRKLTWLMLLGAAIVVIVEIPVFGANQFVIHVDSNATPDGNGSAKFPTTICLRRSRRARMVRRRPKRALAKRIKPRRGSRSGPAPN